MKGRYQFNLRNELMKRLTLLTCDYRIYMGQDHKSDREEFHEGLIGVQ